MSIGDKNFDDEDGKLDAEQRPDTGSRSDKSPESELPAPESNDAAENAITSPDDQEKGGSHFSASHLAKRLAAIPVALYNKTPPGQRRSNRVVLIGLAGIIGIGVAVPAIWLGFNPLPNIQMLKDYRPIEAVKIYDIHDQLAAVVSGDEDRLAVKLNTISPVMKNAMLAAEDHEFYQHDGFNVASMARAAMKNFFAGHVVEGASTITQQLVKNLFFPSEERTINAKIKEIVLATQVDAQYTKEQILEMYLNQIYFGNQAYGIERAAQRYFNKSASQLSLAESAFLAGLVKAPSALAYPAHRQAAMDRQHVVLDKMIEYNLATPAEVAAAKKQKLVFRKFVSPYQKYPFYVAYVMDQLHAKYATEEIQRGMKVYTNLDQEAQLAGEKALRHGIDKAPAGVEQGALASVRIDDGAVIALVGGVGQYEKNQWNRAVSPHTMGSSFKPFVYLTGFLNGKNPEDIVVDSPVSFPSGGTSWSPRNFEGGFRGPMTIRKALAFSRNVCAAKVAYEVGITNVIKTAHLSGLTSKMEPYMPVSLGAAAASPIEMAGAYATFARGGVQIKPEIFRRIDNNDGKVLKTFDVQPRKVFDSTATAKLVDIMQTVVTGGTGTRAQLKNRPVAGKTGTSDAARDIWFVGFTADTACAVWGGNDHNKAIHNRGVTGGMVMAAIFKDYMEGYYAKHPTPVLAFLTPNKQVPSVATDSKDASNPKAATNPNGTKLDAAANPNAATKLDAAANPNATADVVTSTKSSARKSRIAQKKSRVGTVERQVDRSAVVGDDAKPKTAEADTKGADSAAGTMTDLEKQAASAPVIHRMKINRMPQTFAPTRPQTFAPTAPPATSPVRTQRYLPTWPAATDSNSQPPARQNLYPQWGRPYREGPATNLPGAQQ